MSENPANCPDLARRIGRQMVTLARSFVANDSFTINILRMFLFGFNTTKAFYRAIRVPGQLLGERDPEGNASFISR